MPSTRILIALSTLVIVVAILVVAGCEHGKTEKGDQSTPAEKFSVPVPDGTPAERGKHPTALQALDGKGLFPLREDLAAELGIRQVTTSDWLLDEDGDLTHSERGSRTDYDREGHVIGFSGYIDQIGPTEIEARYEGGRLVEERFYAPGEKGQERVLVGTRRYAYPRPGIKESVSIDGDGNIKRKQRYFLDDDDEEITIEALDPSTGDVQGSITKDYDEHGNLIEERMPDRVLVYSFADNVLSVATYLGEAELEDALHSIKRYRFDDNGNLLSYRRASGDGSHWDQFVYALDERGLPVERTWSRLELDLQDPYQVTRYEYRVGE